MAVLDHYGREDLTARIAAALEGRADLAWADLAPLDQFHVRGLAATRELAAGLELRGGETILDVGSGLGGPARHLAAEHGARVTGIDLSQPFVDAATMLAQRVGLADRVSYRQGDALDLPFETGSFDHAWSQHVAMNIADRARLYGGIRRVLKPGGRFAIYDVVAGDGQPLAFPLPWAASAESSFLLTEAGMDEILRRTGFAPLLWEDRTGEGIAWFARQVAAPAPLGLPLVMGPRFPEMVANLRHDLIEGRIRLIQAIVERS